MYVVATGAVVDTGDMVATDTGDATEFRILVALKI